MLASSGLWWCCWRVPEAGVSRRSARGFLHCRCLRSPGRVVLVLCPINSILGQFLLALGWLTSSPCPPHEPEGNYGNLYLVVYSFPPFTGADCAPRSLLGTRGSQLVCVCACSFVMLVLFNQVFSLSCSLIRVLLPSVELDCARSNFGVQLL